MSLTFCCRRKTGRGLAPEFYNELDKFLTLLADRNFAAIEQWLAALDRPPLPPIVFVEGNIAIGKTSFLNLLSDPRILKVAEPVEIWSDIVVGSNGKSIFVNYYERAYPGCGNSNPLSYI